MLYLFEIRLCEGHTAREFAQAWQQGSRQIQQAPDALGVLLHRKLGDDRALIAIARWAGEADGQARLEEILRGAPPCCQVKVLGPYEEAEWVIEPGQPQRHADWGRAPHQPRQ